MATLYPRQNRNGTISWRVMFRRVGLKPFITSFSTKERAEEFIEKYEKDYANNPDLLNWDKLKQARLREFKED